MQQQDLRVTERRSSQQYHRHQVSLQKQQQAEQKQIRKENVETMLHNKTKQELNHKFALMDQKVKEAQIRKNQLNEEKRMKAQYHLDRAAHGRNNVSQHNWSQTLHTVGKLEQGDKQYWDHKDALQAKVQKNAGNVRSKNAFIKERKSIVDKQNDQKVEEVIKQINRKNLQGETVAKMKQDLVAAASGHFKP